MWTLITNIAKHIDISSNANVYHYSKTSLQILHVIAMYRMPHLVPLLTMTLE